MHSQGVGTTFVVMNSMVRRLLIFTLFLGGCAAERSINQSSTVTVPAPQTEAVASALVFDPPVIANEPVLQLDREAREIAAFAGYHETITTFFYLRVHDRQILDDHGRYERRAISESIGVSYR